MQAEGSNREEQARGAEDAHRQVDGEWDSPSPRLRIRMIGFLPLQGSYQSARTTVNSLRLDVAKSSGSEAMTRTRSFRVSTSRSAGAVDRRDVIIGGVLLFSIPIIFGFVGPKPKDDPFAFGKRPNIVAEPDQEEVEARWKIAEQAYQTNAKAFVKNATETEDGTLKEYFRRWAMRSLTCASAAAADVTNLLNDEKFPEARRVSRATSRRSRS
jgi:hypothetical protein